MQHNRNTTVNITNRTMVRAILWVVAAVMVYHFIEQLGHALTIIFVSFFLALALNPVVSAMKKRLRIKSRAKATAAAYLLVIAFLSGFFVLVTPPLVVQTRDFITEVPAIVEDFQGQDSSISRAIYRYNLDERLANAANDFASEYSDFGSTILDTGRRVVGVLVSALAVIVLTFMMLVEGPAWLEKFWALMPARNRQHHRQLANKMYRSVSGFVNGQVVLAVLAGIFAFCALVIASNILNVGVNASALAGIVAVLALIPLFGNPISSAIVILVCALNSVTLAIVMLVYFLVYYQIENLTFQPYIQSRLNQLTPMLVFIAALVGISFGGLLGAIVAIPAASIIKILLEDQLDRRGIRKSKA